MRGDPRIVKTKGVREEALKGAQVMYEAVAGAFGPTSGNFALQKSYGDHVITHDGVTIAKDIILRDQGQNVGAELLYQASRKSDDISGDGTTGTVILAYHILRKANERVAAGYNPMGLRRGIDKASLWLKDELDKLATPVPDDKLHEVATISAGDPEVGKLVADTVLSVGATGLSVEEYEGLGIIPDIIEGLYFEKGYAAEHFVNETATQEAVHQNMHVICLEKRIRDNADIVPILQLVEQQEHKAILIIGNLSGKALNTAILNSLGPNMRVCVVPPPVYGAQIMPFLEDVAAMTGGKLVPENLSANDVTEEYLGFAEKIIVDRTTTVIQGGKGDLEQIQNRIDTLQKQLKNPKNNAQERERMEKRLSKLNRKIGIIRVGGATDAERAEIKFRVDDAVNATRGAKEEGVVPGGATTLARLSESAKMLEALKDLRAKDEEEGAKVVFEALQEPFKRLMENAGEDPGFRLQQVLRSKKGYGFNVKDMGEKPIDLLAAGVIDPVRVLKSIVENSCSVAGIAVTLNGSTEIDRDFQLEQVQLNKAGIGQ